ERVAELRGGRAPSATPLPHQTIARRRSGRVADVETRAAALERGPAGSVRRRGAGDRVGVGAGGADEPDAQDVGADVDRRPGIAIPVEVREVEPVGTRREPDGGGEAGATVLDE